MKKSKATKSQRKASVKRGTRKPLREKKVQQEKYVKKMQIIEERKKAEMKQNEEIMKILQSRDLSIA
jgi:hypothetical protein